MNWRPLSVRRRLVRGPVPVCSRKANPAALSNSRSHPHACLYDMPLLCAAPRSDPSPSTASSKSALPSPNSVRGPIVSHTFALTPRLRGRGVERVMGVSINRLGLMSLTLQQHDDRLGRSAAPSRCEGPPNLG